MASTPIQDDERDERPGGASDTADASDASQSDAPDAPGAGVASWREEMLDELAAISREQGKVLFDGEWLTPEEVKRHHWRLRLQSLRLIFEVIVLCAAFVVVAYVLWILLIIMGGVDPTPV